MRLWVELTGYGGWNFVSVVSNFLAKLGHIHLQPTNYHIPGIKTYSPGIGTVLKQYSSSKIRRFCRTTQKPLIHWSRLIPLCDITTTYKERRMIISEAYRLWP
ncbi:hypothetical protein M0802_002397 [Mischocyttarus mexicanus]|nr:hypothetical protein M0802_002397 [Mischocyttarus mexicanus]